MQMPAAAPHQNTATPLVGAQCKLVRYRWQLLTWFMSGAMIIGASSRRVFSEHSSPGFDIGPL